MPENFDAKKAWQITKNILAMLWKYHKVALIFAVIFLLFNVTAQAAGSLFLKKLIDEYIVPMHGLSHPDFTPLLHLLFLMAGIYMLGLIGNYLAQRLMISTTQHFMQRMRNRLFTHMQRLGVSYFDARQTGEIMSHYTNDMEMMRQFIATGLGISLSSVLNLSMVTITMFIISPTLALIQLGTTVIIVPAVVVLAKRSARYFRQQQADMGHLNGYIEEMIAGQKVIKVFSHEEQAVTDFARYNDALHASVTKAVRNGNMIWPMLGNFGYFQYITVAMVGGMLALSGVGGLTLGAIASFLNLSRSFTFPIAEAFGQFNIIMMAIAGAERIFTLLEESEEAVDGQVHLVAVEVDKAGNFLQESTHHTEHWAWKEIDPQGNATYTQLRGEIRFEAVNFSYVSGKTVLEAIDFEAKAGQKVALVGSTGAGKTTITNLLNRFYEIDSGRILYDGIDIKRIHKHDLRRSLGMVLQDTHLFSGSIYDNLRYGRLSASNAEVEEAAKRAGAEAFILAMEGGYAHVIEGESSALSQGQKQLLSIARAEVADPPVMILDEATSSIDTKTEAVVQRGMDSLMQGRTVFVIAHRLSTIQNSDLILVIEQGKIAESGNHESLMQAGGIYYRLVTQNLNDTSEIYS
ncbi:ABC transporter ATP-binding protein [Spirochaetales bacterium BR151]|uniref:ABC transporter ATP-binding protein n=2 Tax=Entomospira culicis TaxID=2719989 RepID=A0A968GHF1_9SPIO|nr:ABC transporter ATP-binding protein [Entomospira culicis]NIZ70153.1 ABC transporter ATP-binding protein [Entomospira culicis]